MSPRDPQRIQRALVCMLHDPAYAARVLDDRDVHSHADDRAQDGLQPGELALLRAIDPRALTTDPLRRARAVTAILEEFPISGALLGVAAVDAFFSRAEFRRAVFAGGAGSMALSFGTWLEDQTLGVGRVEAALAGARRRWGARATILAGLAADHLVVAPGVAALIVPAGTLAWIERAQGRLGADPLAALAALRRPWPQRPPRRGEEGLIAQTSAAGDLSLGTASLALVRLLAAAAAPLPGAALRARAQALGCDDDDEARALLEQLRSEGLLSP